MRRHIVPAGLSAEQRRELLDSLNSGDHPTTTMEVYGTDGRLISTHQIPVGCIRPPLDPATPASASVSKEVQD